VLTLFYSLYLIFFLFYLLFFCFFFISLYYLIFFFFPQVWDFFSFFLILFIKLDFHHLYISFSHTFTDLSFLLYSLLLSFFLSFLLYRWTVAVWDFLLFIFDSSIFTLNRFLQYILHLLSFLLIRT
jgi:hypothetical protein